ncbi:hypothetical protein GA0070216_113103 [Micromonospora matsumotoense]|uniref:Uncharacterized protein n=1 Tax=Micromonospora matsumotoense TaxID=121616 RepID=A0A1C5A464_9ACTN|nr:hypothetical protein [Micromonospora matsumotoense]SCF40012.1 hypothetical protein GA0070216_113103 [Micromonospora matsumotoense]
MMGFLRSHPPAAILRHTVGNALVLHARERISPQARSLALTVVEDPDHDIVVLDLYEDPPVGIWESVAATLRRRRRRRGIRLIVCGVPHQTGALAGQWLCDRLRRPVVTPHGQLVRATNGTLFVPTTEGSGWVRYRPGRTPVWESQRYPAPPWDGSAAQFTPTSAVAAVEPIPGGVWIRDTRDAVVVSDRGQWLVSAVPCQNEAMTVVLGCPGTPPLALDSVARFWRGLDPDGRRQARFVHYGPVQLPVGEALGQRLADLLESPVVCFAGVPVGRPDRLRMFTVRPDGCPGWQVFTRDLCFSPRRAAADPATLPRILSHEAPPLLGDPVGPLTYQYASDAVVEIVQSGLWVRDAEVPPNAGRIRAHLPDPASLALIVDDTVPARLPRLRELADDLTARLDPATRGGSALQLASAVAAGRRARSAVADGTLDDGRTYRFTAADLALDDGRTYRFTAADLALDEPVEVAPPPAEVRAGMTAPGPLSPSWVPTIPPVADVPGLAAAEFVVAPVEQARAPEAVPDLNGAPAPQAHRIGGRAAGPAGGRLVPVAPTGERRQPAVPAGPVPLRTSSGRLTDPATTTALWHQPASVDTPTGTGGPRPRPVRPPAAPRSGPPPAEPVLAAPTSARESASASTAAPPREVVSVSDSPAGEAGQFVRFQATPASQARGPAATSGLDAERSWLRRRFHQEFDAATSAISRLLAEHPRLQAGGESVTDAVAVRLYLSAPGDGVDQALRSGAVGDPVLFARCVTAGMSRLPSYRGAVCLSTRLSGDELQEIGARRVLTERAFTHALTDPAVNLPGNVDVLLWSMTARRTRLLEPEGDHHVDSRVLFLPGTRFRVLEVAAPGQDHPGRLLLRELAADEPVGEPGPFDDLALASLRRCVDRWAATARRSRVGSASVPRLTCLPGLV